MTNRWMNALLAGLIGLGLLGCRGQVSTKPPMHPNWNMDQQNRYDPQEPSEFFADGRSMRTPVVGTVPYGTLLDDDDKQAHFYEGKVDGELAATLPDGLELNDALLERGQARYNIYCQPCHGMAGGGDGIVTELSPMIPPSFHDPRLQSMPIGHFFNVMTEGLNTMPSYRSQVPAVDRWAIATYVRALQVSSRAGEDLGPIDAAEEEGTDGE